MWRIVKARYASAAWSGEGARRWPGRWNGPGSAVVYTADSPALAMLEILVNLGHEGLLQSSYVLASADVPDALVEELDAARLPPNWSASPCPPAVQALGDAWVAGGSSVALRVPSAVVEGHNVLLNPAHPAFREVKLGEPKPLRVDARLTKAP